MIKKPVSLLAFFTLLFFVNPSQAQISIAEARTKSLGTQVTVTGYVTVTDEFHGPVYFQDETGGLAWFDSANMRENFTIDIQRGDSIVITGELGEFNEALQIVGEVEYEIYPDANKIVESTEITVEELNSGDFEGQLVSIEVEIDHSGSFQGNINYDIEDETGSGELRIDQFTEIAGAMAPEGITTIIGVVDRFYENYQLKPRDLNDIDAQIQEVPGENVTMDQTLDVVTWNVEWFGAGNGPGDDELQFENVKTVIETIGADLYALQEVSDPNDFNRLIEELENYGGILASFDQTQKTAFLFNRSTLDSLDSGLITEGMTSNYWAGGNNEDFARFPLSFHFEANINGESQEIYAYTIHAKATTDNPSSDYNQRLQASTELKAYLDNNKDQDNVIVLGDYNDEILQSVVNGNDSPYKNFVDDSEYSIVTKNLEEKGYRSQSGGSFLDHIMFTSELSDEYFEGTERVENTNYIGSYLSTTSDHYPVWTRFKFGEIEYTDNENEIAGLPEGFSLEQNYPNPFNPTTVISYQLAANSEVNLEVFDVMGRKVATLVNSEVKTAGEHKINFDASALSSGVYIYRLSTSEGIQMSRKMLLIK